MNLKKDFCLSATASGRTLYIKIHHVEGEFTIFEKFIEVSHEETIEEIVKRLRHLVFEEGLIYRIAYNYLCNLTSIDPRGKNQLEVANLINQEIRRLVASKGVL